MATGPGRQVKCRHCKELFTAGSRHFQVCRKNPARVPVMTDTRIGVLRLLASKPDGTIYGADFPEGRVPAGSLGTTTGTLLAMHKEALIQMVVNGRRLLSVAITPYGRTFLPDDVAEAAAEVAADHVHTDDVDDVDVNAAMRALRQPNKRTGKKRRKRTPWVQTIERVTRAVEDGADTVPKIARAIGWSTNGGSVYSIVSKAVADGKIARVEKGRYGPVAGRVVPVDENAALVPLPAGTVEVIENNGETRRVNVAAELRKQADVRQRAAAAMTALGYPDRTRHIEPIRWIEWYEHTKDMISNGS